MEALSFATSNTLLVGHQFNGDSPDGSIGSSPASLYNRTGDSPSLAYGYAQQSDFGLSQNLVSNSPETELNLSTLFFNEDNDVSHFTNSVQYDKFHMTTASDLNIGEMISPIGPSIYSDNEHFEDMFGLSGSYGLIQSSTGGLDHLSTIPQRSAESTVQESCLVNIPAQDSSGGNTISNNVSTLSTVPHLKQTNEFGVINEIKSTKENNSLSAKPAEECNATVNKNGGNSVSNVEKPSVNKDIEVITLDDSDDDSKQIASSSNTAQSKQTASSSNTSQSKQTASSFNTNSNTKKRPGFRYNIFRERGDLAKKNSTPSSAPTAPAMSGQTSDVAVVAVIQNNKNGFSNNNKASNRASIVVSSSAGFVITNLSKPFSSTATQNKISLSGAQNRSSSPLNLHRTRTEGLPDLNVSGVGADGTDEGDKKESITDELIENIMKKHKLKDLNLSEASIDNVYNEEVITEKNTNDEIENNINDEEEKNINNEEEKNINDEEEKSINDESVISPKRTIGTDDKILVQTDVICKKKLLEENVDIEEKTSLQERIDGEEAQIISLEHIANSKDEAPENILPCVDQSLMSHKTPTKISPAPQALDSPLSFSGKKRKFASLFGEDYDFFIHITPIAKRTRSRCNAEHKKTPPPKNTPPGRVKRGVGKGSKNIQMCISWAGKTTPSSTCESDASDDDDHTSSPHKVPESDDQNLGENKIKNTTNSGIVCSSSSVAANESSLEAKDTTDPPASLEVTDLLLNNSFLNDFPLVEDERLHDLSNIFPDEAVVNGINFSDLINSEILTDTACEVEVHSSKNCLGSDSLEMQVMNSLRQTTQSPDLGLCIDPSTLFVQDEQPTPSWEGSNTVGPATLPNSTSVTSFNTPPLSPPVGNYNLKNNAHYSTSHQQEQSNTISINPSGDACFTSSESNAAWQNFSIPAFSLTSNFENLFPSPGSNCNLSFSNDNSVSNYISGTQHSLHTTVSQVVPNNAPVTQHEMTNNLPPGSLVYAVVNSSGNLVPFMPAVAPSAVPHHNFPVIDDHALNVVTDVLKANANSQRVTSSRNDPESTEAIEKTKALLLSASSKFINDQLAQSNGNLENNSMNPDNTNVRKHPIVDNIAADHTYCISPCKPEKARETDVEHPSQGNFNVTSESSTFVSSNISNPSSQEPSDHSVKTEASTADSGLVSDGSVDHSTEPLNPSAQELSDHSVKSDASTADSGLVSDGSVDHSTEQPNVYCKIPNYLTTSVEALDSKKKIKVSDYLKRKPAHVASKGEPSNKIILKTETKVAYNAKVSSLDSMLSEDLKDPTMSKLSCKEKTTKPSSSETMNSARAVSRKKKSSRVIKKSHKVEMTKQVNPIIKKAEQSSMINSKEAKEMLQVLQEASLMSIKDEFVDNSVNVKKSGDVAIAAASHSKSEQNSVSRDSSVSRSRDSSTMSNSRSGTQSRHVSSDRTTQYGFTTDTEGGDETSTKSFKSDRRGRSSHKIHKREYKRSRCSSNSSDSSDDSSYCRNYRDGRDHKRKRYSRSPSRSSATSASYSSSSSNYDNRSRSSNRHSHRRKHNRRSRSRSFSPQSVYSIGCACQKGNPEKRGHTRSCRYYQEPTPPTQYEVNPFMLHFGPQGFFVAQYNPIFEHSRLDKCRDHEIPLHMLSKDLRTKMMEMRLVLYIGDIRDGTDKHYIKQRFRKFGPIVDISIYYRETGNNYGFVTFTNSEHCQQAIRHGNDGYDVHYDLCFGGRREFCRQQYRDLDAQCDDQVYFPRRSHIDNSSRVSCSRDFDSLLKEMMSRR